MKTLLTLFLGLCLFQPQLSFAQLSEMSVAHLPHSRGSLKPLLDKMAEQYLVDIDEELGQGARAEAKLIKYFILKGQITKAKAYTQSLLLSQHKLKPILLRYLSYLYFLDNKFDQSYEILKQEPLTSFSHFKQTCLMKTILEITLDKNNVKNTWQQCKLAGGKLNLIGEISWIDVLVELKSQKNIAEIKKIFKKINLKTLDNESLKFYLKLAIFIDQDKHLLKEIEEFDYSVFADEELREIMAVIFFRNNQFNDAWKISENLHTANIENIKGILYLLSGKKELAYAQFQLALQKKSNSFNAVQRALPLSVLLELPEDGIKLIKNANKHVQNKDQARSIEAYFLTKLQKNSEALKSLLDLYHLRTGSSEIEINSMISFNSIVLNDQKNATRFSHLSCKEGDFMSCWSLIQMNSIEDFPLVIRRDEPVVSKTVEVESLINEDSFKDTIYINQKDIDELDDQLIKLTKSN